MFRFTEVRLRFNTLIVHDCHSTCDMNSNDDDCAVVYSVEFLKIFYSHSAISHSVMSLFVRPEYWYQYSFGDHHNV